MPTDWALVYRESFQDLVGFLYRKVWDSDRALDLAQEAFARALSHDPEQPRTWVFTIATNLARDEARTAIRRKKHLALIKDDDLAMPTPAPDPHREMEDRERDAGVRAALDRLSERDRDILLLWQAGLSYGEIAEQTELSVGAIGTTLARARRRLVELYTETERNDVARG
ncbi:MAG TPA: sigma-70 family RNA polymerase sigma factor [Longimicrobiales bacterium]|nr:sigma-70 family RNA polymerase sigma factor [Longimicrobiales bacterium]